MYQNIHFVLYICDTQDLNGLRPAAAYFLHPIIPACPGGAPDQASHQYVRREMNAQIQPGKADQSCQYQRAYGRKPSVLIAESQKTGDGRRKGSRGVAGGEREIPWCGNQRNQLRILLKGAGPPHQVFQENIRTEQA